MAKRISKERAIELFKAFKDTKSKELNKIVKNISNGKHKEDAVSSWFSLNDLEDYINYLKTNDPNVNGVRIYLGAYSDKVKPKKDDECLTTVFMVPTKPGTSTGLAEKSTMVSSTSTDNEDDPNLEALNGGTIGEPPSTPPYGED